MRFAGQYLDAESGFYYLRARYYEPATGQFLSLDPAANRTREPYGYVMDSPLNRTDSSGLDGPCGFNSTYYQSLRFKIDINCYVISGEVTFNFAPNGPGATAKYSYWYQILSPGELDGFNYTSPKSGRGVPANTPTTSVPRPCEVGTWGAATIVTGPNWSANTFSVDDCGSSTSGNPFKVLQGGLSLALLLLLFLLLGCEEEGVPAPQPRPAPASSLLPPFLFPSLP
jgi:RHS repeat-associated protein